MKKNADLTLLEQTAYKKMKTLFGRIHRRIVCQRIYDSIMTGLLYAEIGSIVFFLVYNLLYPWSMSLPLYFAATLLIGIAAGLSSYLFSESEEYEAEKRTDQYYSLENRFLTMAELLAHPEKSVGNEIAILQVKDCITCLSQIQPQKVVPLRFSNKAVKVLSLFFVMAVVTSIMIQSPPTLEAKVSDPTVLDIITDLEQNLRRPLKAMIRENPDREELKELDRHTVSLLKKLNESSEDPKKSLSILSRLDQEIRSVVESYQIEATDQSFKDIGKALLNEKGTKKAAAALLEENYDTAATELERIDFDSLSRDQRESLAQKLKDAAKTIKERKQNQLAQLADQLAEELMDAKCASCKNTSCKLAGSCKKQKANKALAQKLNCQLARLGLCKSNCAGACANCQNACPSKQGGKQKSQGASPSASTQAGTETASAPLSGTESDLKTSREQHLAEGIQNEEGASVNEIVRSDQHNKEQIKTGKSNVFLKYKKEMESVLDSEDIPLDQRRVIRTYFESIRPQIEKKEDPSLPGISDDSNRGNRK